ncbi:radical SAM protein [Bacillus sp. A301a_S52]|jgi:radical SAM protein with 4Fe4S-binding SPASM domain|nr:radical SAM protein [Bacillus sp. A301a_S52]
MFKKYAEFLAGNLCSNKENKKTLPMFLNHLSTKKDVLLDSPLIAGLIITDDCNLHCPHCYSKNNNNFFEYDQILKIIDELNDNDVINIYITGGEPFLHPNILEIIQYIKTKKAILTIHTNGILLNKEIIFELSELLNKNDTLQISLDGIKLETNLKTRTINLDNYLTIKKNIRSLICSGLQVKLNITVTNHNIKELLDIYITAEELGVQSIAYSSLFVTNNKFTFPPTSYNLIKEFEKVLKYATDKKFPVKIVQNPLAVTCGNKNIISIIEEKYGQDSIPIYDCPAGTTGIEINHDGEVYACPFLREKKFSAGNIFTQRLHHIWQEGFNWDFLRENKSNNYNNCKYYDFCKGACPAQSYYMYGTLNQCDPRCEEVSKW